MNDGIRQGLRIAVGSLLAMVLVVGLPLAWFAGGMWRERHRVEAEVSAFCRAIPVGADTATLLREAGQLGITLSHDPGGATYRYRRLMAGYDEISCEFTVDGAGIVVARTFHPLGPIRVRRAASDSSVSG